MNQINAVTHELLCVISGTTSSSGEKIHPIHSERTGSTPISEAIDAYMLAYCGKDQTRGQRMAWWQSQIGHLRLNEVDEDHIFYAIESLNQKNARYYAGKDADGNAIFKSKGKPYAPATINRYVASIGALFTWCIKRRIVPKGWEHPCRTIERKPENNEVVRFLCDKEREALLMACKSSKWHKLYLLVMLGLTTGGRKSELLGLRWEDINLERCEAYIRTTKNGDKKTLPLVPSVVNELSYFKTHANQLVFASQRRPDKAYNFVPVWELALKQAKVKNFRFHDLRHSCASYLAQNNATLLEIADVLGHRNTSITKRYSHLTTGHKSKLINRVLGGIN